MTKLTTASVKVMRSYDYCHFEVNLGISNEEGLEVKEVDDLRKTCQRLVDKAVGQYQKAKQNAANRVNTEYKIKDFENRCMAIEAKPEGDRTINEIAMLKQYKDENWRAQFEERYDYEDEEDDGLSF